MQPQLKNQSSDLSLDGLEGILESAPVSADTNTAPGAEREEQDWTVEESARALGLSRGAVIRRLEDGIIPGYKVQRGRAWVWRVKPIWLGPTAKKSEEGAVAEKGSDQNQEPPLAPESPATCFVEIEEDSDAEHSELPLSTYKELIELRTKLEMTEKHFQEAKDKLDAASYKIGYLEARYEASQEQLRLITDQSMCNQSWWQRLGQIFTGK